MIRGEPFCPLRTVPDGGTPVKGLRRIGLRRWIGITLLGVGVFLLVFPFEVQLSPDQVLITGPFFVPAILPMVVGIVLLLPPRRDRVPGMQAGRRDSQ